MTLWDAILATLGGAWAILSAPLAVLFYGFIACFSGIVIFAGGCESADDPFWTRIPYWLIGAAVFLFGASLLVWISGSPSPFTWSKP